MDKPATLGSRIFTVGGTVQAGGGIYITRQADFELLELCREGAFAYVLTTRQLGKSSLMVQTARQLREEGIASVLIDLTQIGVRVTQDQWYFGVVSLIEDQLALKTDLIEWWEKNDSVSVAQRLILLFQKVVLAEVFGKVVIFIDEIDTTLSIDFADDFFAAIRSLYNARVQVPEFRRLSFVLLGVAAPNDLIKDPTRTPFNIGRSVELTDFTFDEAAPFADGLPQHHDKAPQILRWILDWTGGHPYLTQRLCSAIAEMKKDVWTRSDVDEVVNNTFLNRRKGTDTNLQFVEDMLIRRAADPTPMLKTYRKIYHGRRVPDDQVSSVKAHLKLSGVVISQQGILRLRNKIYRKAFDGKWIDDHLPLDRASINFATVMVFLSVVILALTYVFYGVPGIKFLRAASLISALFFSVISIVHLYKIIRNN